MKKTKFLIATLLSLFVGFSGVVAQDKSSRPSPPEQISATVDGVKVTVDYSKPSAKGRKIFGGLVPYNQVWRTGANETSWIEVSEDVTINGENLAKGKYALFTIPGEDSWTIVFNEGWQAWGAYSYEQSKDVLRIKANADNESSKTEVFTITVSDEGAMVLAWDRTKVQFAIAKG